jgi:type IV pilus assembly protein PilF
MTLQWSGARLVVLLGCVAVLGACAGSSVTRPEPSAADTASAFNVQLGVAYMQQGNLAVAQEKLERALRQNPRDPNVHTALALLEERLNHPAKADAHYRDALRLAPRNPDFSNNYAVFLCRNGRTVEALKLFDEAARNPLYRTPAAAYTNAGVCLRSARRFEEAERYLLQALTLQERSPEAALQLGELYLDIGRLREAKTRVDGFIDANGETPEMLWLGVRIARALGDRPAAERYARKLRMNFPGSEQARQLSQAGRGS